MPVEPKTFLLDERVGMFSWNNVIIMEMRGLMDLKHVRALEQLGASLLATFPDGVASVTRLKTGAPVSDREVRQASARVLAGFGDRLHSHCLLEGGGLWAAALRAVFRGMNVLSKHPIAIYDGLASLIAAVAPTVRTSDGATVEPAALGATLEITQLISATFRAA